MIYHRITLSSFQGEGLLSRLAKLIIALILLRLL
ncbi:hypothetical protein AA637_03770 [Cyanobacterium sp. HL-69]|nr:hypothetical protein AA637_03770 [Cyanobacterium sp. HL-69]